MRGSKASFHAFPNEVLSLLPWKAPPYLTLQRKTRHFVIPSEARNLSSIHAQEKKERFLASLGMTK
jgi:hypothetical protein